MEQRKKYFQDLESSLDPGIENADSGCVVSDRISVGGYEIGIMYRDFPIPDTSDSGWVFLAGDEDAVYMNTPGNTSAFPLRIICSYDPAIIPFLDSAYETAFIRQENGEFLKAEHFFDEET
ncbi:DUF2185 domain-containing protein [Christensenella tenuis]|uniref:DUF2185 domain-containing protein n=1 Tax=Christensenella tenuis TaxID=2763033 RepID=A0ABR7EE17_9FIRM|nr:DUF2185 domain-containing protein [Christensenella tenuis]MBC5647398.1 DUF2185 domain-containing protein [Christensenella tenuis]